MFAQFKKFKSTIHSIESSSDGSTSVVEHDLVQHLQSQKLNTNTGAAVNASCNSSITLECLRELYNIGNYTPSANVGNSIGITGYLEEFANFADLQSFYAAQLPQAAAVNSSFGVILLNSGWFFLIILRYWSLLIHGVCIDGTNPQDPADAGVEANLDVQYAFGLSFPVNVRHLSLRSLIQLSDDLFI
jgi:tripeptidyl-peptidase I